MDDSVALGRLADRNGVSRLALAGGRPAFDELLHVGRPNIPDKRRVLQLLEGILERRWLTNGGPCVAELERRLADFLGVRHCLLMCNATVALGIATRAADLGGEVIVPSYTFVATAHALQWQQFTPVFADVDPTTHTLDPAAVESMITPRTTAILGVHTWGNPCSPEALAEVAERRGLKLLFDAAHAFGCSHGGRMIGGFGLAEVFSFHATKFFNTFEGGAVTTNDDALAGRMRLMRNFGFSGFDNVVYVGTNGKMSEPCAAMGLAGLEQLDETIATNRRHHERYSRELGRLPGLSVLQYDPRERNNYQYVVVEVDADAAGLTRDEWVGVLHAEGVLARKYFWPGCHNMEPYKSLFPHAGLVLPETIRVAERVFLLPTGTAVSDADVAAVCGILATASRHPAECRRLLAARPPTPEALAEAPATLPPPRPTLVGAAAC